MSFFFRFHRKVDRNERERSQSDFGGQLRHERRAKTGVHSVQRGIRALFRPQRVHVRSQNGLHWNPCSGHDQRHQEESDCELRKNGDRVETCQRTEASSIEMKNSIVYRRI